MTRDALIRYGCDSCKVQNIGTFVFLHDGTDPVKIWICETCLRQLRDWPGDEEVSP